jgi:hypothetical protein
MRNDPSNAKYAKYSFFLNSKLHRSASLRKRGYGFDYTKVESKKASTEAGPKQNDQIIVMQMEEHMDNFGRFLIISYS